MRVAANVGGFGRPLGAAKVQQWRVVRFVLI
jgi:hypothetical protein